MKLSQAMIVKNEEKNIVRALAWGKRIMSEQIVVDTGSKDDTIALAKQNGAAVFVIPWEDDFSKAKNSAIERCHGDWIAFLDADEYLTKEDAEKLPNIISMAEKTGCDSISASLLELDDEGKVFGGGTLTRFFKNQKDIRYHRCIHEQLSVQKEYDATKELTIYHTGYSASAKREKPSDRNIRLILKELSKHPKDDEMLGYLGDEYRARDQYREAVEAYEKAVSFFSSDLEESNQRAAVTLERLLQLYVFQFAWQKQPNGTTSDMKHISFEQIQALYHKSIKLFPKEPDYDYIMGEFYFGDAEYQEASRSYGKALTKLSTYGFENRALMLMPHIRDTYEKYAFSLYSIGQMKDAVEIATQCIRENHQAMLALKTLLMVFTKDGETPSTVQAILTFLFKIYDQNNLRDKMILYYAAEDANCPEFKKAVLLYFTDEEQDVLLQDKSKHTE